MLSKSESDASLAFGEKYTEDEIRDCQAKFLKRFVTQQFKRSAMPDGPMVTEISLSPRGGLVMPSDAKWDALIKEK